MSENLKQVKSILQETTIYSIGEISLKAATILIVAVLTRILTKGQYGSLELWVSIGAIFVIFGFGLDGALQRYYYGLEKQEQNRLITTAVAFAIFSAVGWMLIGGLISPFINTSGLLIPVLASTMAVNIFNILRSILKLDFRSIRFVAVALVTALLTIISILFFILILKMKVAGYFWGIGLANLFGSLGIIWLIRPKIIFRISAKYLIKLLAYGAPIIISTLPNWVLSLSDRLILANLKTFQDVAVYSIAARISMALTLVMAGFTQAWGPRLMSLLQQPVLLARTTNKFFVHTTWVLSFVTLLLSFFASFFIALLAPGSYATGDAAVGILCFSVVLNSMGAFFGTGILLSSRTMSFVWTTLLAAVANFGLNLLLIPRYNFYGAAIATAIAYGVLMLANKVIAARLYKIDFEERKGYVIALITLGFILVGDMLPGTPLTINLLKVALLVAFLALMLLFKIIEPGEVQIVRNFLQANWRRIRKKEGPS